MTQNSTPLLTPSCLGAHTQRHSSDAVRIRHRGAALEPVSPTPGSPASFLKNASTVAAECIQLIAIVVFRPRFDTPHSDHGACYFRLVLR